MKELHEDDHRAQANQLDLYHIEEEAPGMIFWHPRGYQIYRELEDYIRLKMRRLGYQEVKTPQLLPRSLWERSGHWDKFGEQMFVVPRENERDLALKPMSCPCHLQIFKDRRRSWRELPLRYAEFGACHRDEPSGAMHGLMRTRAFEQDDAHVICLPDQIADEVERFIGLVREVYAALGFEDFEVALSLRPDVRAGSDEDWDWSEAELMRAARAAGVEPKLLPGEGAFYGPKLEFSLKDRQGRSWQCGTAQLDQVLPKRLGASYVSSEGDKKIPLMIHHAVLGSLGRAIGILIEECSAQLPLWLAPEQVALMPISDAHMDYAREVEDGLLSRDIRAKVFLPSETLSRRIVSARELKIPVFAVLGDREKASRSCALRIGKNQETLPIFEFYDRVDTLCARPQ